MCTCHDGSDSQRRDVFLGPQKDANHMLALTLRWSSWFLVFVWPMGGKRLSGLFLNVLFDDTRTSGRTKGKCVFFLFDVTFRMQQN